MTTDHDPTPARNVPAGFFWSFVLCPLSFVVAGCAPDDFGANDPLLGSAPPRPPGAAIAAGPVAMPTTGVPPLPQTSPSGTPAALASGGRGPLDPSRPELRIGSDAPAPAWSATGVALQPPQPANGGPAPLQPKPAADVQLTSNGTATTYEQLKAQLLARGASVITFTTNAQTGETTLTCLAPVSGKPNEHQRYDAKARDEMAAMRAVLDQMDRKR
jgi:hypothetical protein